MCRFIIVAWLYTIEGRWWQLSRRGFIIHLICWRIDVWHFFCSVEGLQPSLSLLTRDGALLSDDDPVLLVVGSEEVMSTVISWNIPPLTDRYMEACQFLHSGIVSSWPYREHLCMCVCLFQSFHHNWLQWNHIWLTAVSTHEDFIVLIGFL